MRRIGMKALAASLCHRCIPLSVLAPLVTVAFVDSARAQTAPLPTDPITLPPVVVTTSPVGGVTAYWDRGSYAFVNGAFVPVTVVD